MWQAVHRYAENGYVGQQQQSADQMQAGQRAAGRGGAKQKQEISLGHRIGLVKGWGWGKSVQASSWHGRWAAAGLLSTERDGVHCGSAVHAAPSSHRRFAASLPARLLLLLLLLPALWPVCGQPLILELLL